MMSARYRLMFATLSILACSAALQAEPFAVPLEDYGLTPPLWNTPFPYQRNVFLGFDTDPATWPVIGGSPVYGGPGVADLIPQWLPNANYHLEGYKDDQVYESDYADAGGEDALEWWDTLAGTARQGFLGFWEQESYEAWFKIHLDNLPEPKPIKHLVIEIEYYVLGTGDAHLGIDLPGGHNVVNQLEAPVMDAGTGDGFVRSLLWYEFEPNPPWEDLTFTLTSDEFEIGGYVIDHIHIATECVPEPATFSLLALGLPLIRRRKRISVL